MDELEKIIASNLVKYRKREKLTQLELAEKLKYSDKNISKWERAEATPDVVILKQLADLYKISVEDFLCEHSQLEKEENEIKEKKVKTKFMNKKQYLITFLSVSIVWLVATLVFSVFQNISLYVNDIWKIFVYALPLSFVIILIFSCIWCTNMFKAITVSFLIWSTALSTFISFDVSNIWLVFIVAIPIQILDILWFALKKLNKNLKLTDEEKEKIKQDKLEKKLLKRQKKIEKNFLDNKSEEHN